MTKRTIVRAMATWIGIVWVAIIVVVVLLALGVRPVRSAEPPHPGCQPYKVSSYSPTGIVGCQVYGVGTASWYHGTSVARNDCVWPWKHCQPIKITSTQTGRSIVVVPRMFCDCWLGLAPGTTGPGGERPRIADLDPATVAALGLNLSSGLFEVEIEPATTSSTMPNTAMEQP